jgi:hypothetical protein
VTYLAEERDQVLDTLVVLFIRYAVGRREFKEKGGYLRHFAATSRDRGVVGLWRCSVKVSITALAVIVASCGLRG